MVLSEEETYSDLRAKMITLFAMWQIYLRGGCQKQTQGNQLVDSE